MNKMLKSTAGYINHVNDKEKDTLRKLELALPEVCEYIADFEGDSSSDASHKEMTESFVSQFMADCRKVHTAILTNPFPPARYMCLILQASFQMK